MIATLTALANTTVSSSTCYTAAMKARFLNTTFFSLLFVVALVGCSPTPPAVTSVSGPDTLAVNESGRFEAITNEAEGNVKQPVANYWNFGDGQSANGLVATHSYNREGTYTVIFTMQNDTGSDSQSLEVFVYRPIQPPVIVGIRKSPDAVDTRTNVSFTANLRGDTPTYAWDFGDGSSSTEAAPSHMFTSPGEYVVGLTVTNEAGEASRTINVEVKPFEAAICRETTVLQSVSFSMNSSTLSDDAKAELQGNLEVLNECPNVDVIVEGLSSSNERRYQQLALDRAESVASHYETNGVLASRIEVKANPVGDRQTIKDQGGPALFRRVDSIPVRRAP